MGYWPMDDHDLHRLADDGNPHHDDHAPTIRCACGHTKDDHASGSHRPYWPCKYSGCDCADFAPG